MQIDGVPVADVIHCWLDVSGEPARGAEQASFIWRRVLGPAIAHSEVVGGVTAQTLRYIDILLPVGLLGFTVIQAVAVGWALWRATHG